MDQQEHEITKGTFWLSSAALISRIIGVAYRIPLNRFFGPEIMGMYQLVYPVYQLLVLFSISSFPTALARLVAQEKGAGRNRIAHDIFISALLLLGGAGAFFINSKLVSKFLARPFFSPQFFLKTLLCLSIMAAGSVLVYILLVALTGLHGIALAVAIITGAALYLYMILRVNLFSYQEIQAIPRYGEKIASYFYKEG